MFSTRLVKERFIIPCVIVTDIPSRNTFVVDTGAKYTCCSIYNINPLIEKANFKGAETKNIGGLVYGSTITYHKYHVKQFTIGTVDLKEQDIWVTFDERATDDVLGMDIMKSIYLVQDPKKEELIFFCDKNELKAYCSSL